MISFAAVFCAAVTGASWATAVSAVSAKRLGRRTLEALCMAVDYRLGHVAHHIGLLKERYL